MSDWKNFLTLSPVGEGVKQVYYSNGKFIGNIIQDVDGYWKYSFPNAHGLWEESHLQMIASMLTELNTDWDNEVKEYFGHGRLEESGTGGVAGDTSVQGS